MLFRSGELLPGSWNQTVWGDVLQFPVRDVPLSIVDGHPLTSDRTPLADFDMTAAYSINPACVSDLWSKKSRTFHGVNSHNEYLLMQQFVQTTLNTAATKAISKHAALEISNKQAEIQTDIHDIVTAELKETGYGECLSVNSIQVRSLVPAADILQSAKNVVIKANELKAKEAEVAIAEAESRRMSAIAQSQANQRVMELETQRILALAVREGKVQTMILPSDFKGIVTTQVK